MSRTANDNSKTLHANLQVNEEIQPQLVSKKFLKICNKVTKLSKAKEELSNYYVDGVAENFPHLLKMLVRLKVMIITHSCPIIGTDD